MFADQTIISPAGSMCYPTMPGCDLPQLQKPEVTYPTAKMLASLPEGSPSGEVFWDEKIYPLFHPDNAINQQEKP